MKNCPKYLKNLTPIHILSSDSVNSFTFILDENNKNLNLNMQDFSINWDYVQSCFFALTILTTIGGF